MLSLHHQAQGAMFALHSYFAALLQASRCDDAAHPVLLHALHAQVTAYVHFMFRG